MLGAVIGSAAVGLAEALAPGVVIYRLDDRLFFADARSVKGRVLEAVRGAPPSLLGGSSSTPKAA